MSEPWVNVPWVNEDGSTNVDGWLTAYADDVNTFWRSDRGHIMNVVEELIDESDRLRRVKSCARSLLNEHRDDPGGSGEETLFDTLAETLGPA